ncbi:hypothetical protein [Halomonas halocynthiae]|uniref:hypothetical protein n=1 Tax=Halomonas halocynthiae TaxID=176290 RepID=UPI0003FB2518|nr:hypothetical protein [Halomonas halocynthiae]
MSLSQQLSASAERTSLMTGLVLVILCNVPRFMVGGYETRLILAVAFAVAVAIAGAFQWRQLSIVSRKRVPMLVKRLLGCFVGGIAAIGLMYWFSGGWIGWELWLAYGTGTGLIGFALWVWWMPQPD